MTFSAASCKLRFFEAFSFLKIWIKSVMRLGQTDLKSLFKLMVESLISKILMQKRINIKSAGEGLSCFMTSFKDYKTVLNLFSYLSTLPE